MEREMENMHGLARLGSTWRWEYTVLILVIISWYVKDDDSSGVLTRTGSLFHTLQHKHRHVSQTQLPNTHCEHFRDNSSIEATRNKDPQLAGLRNGVSCGTFFFPCLSDSEAAHRTRRPFCSNRDNSCPWPRCSRPRCADCPLHTETSAIFLPFLQPAIPALL